MIDSGIARPIKIADIMFEIKEDLGIENSTTYDSIVFRQIYYGALALDSRATYIKKSVSMDVVDYRFRLPNGFIRVLSIEIPVEENTNRRSSDYVLYYDSDMASGSGFTGDSAGYQAWNQLGQIVGEYFVFNTEFLGSRVCMTYEGLNLDEDCMITLTRDQVMAISAYVKFQMATMKRCASLFLKGAVEMHGREWVAQKSYLQGEAFLREADNAKTQIKDMFTAMFVDENYIR